MCNYWQILGLEWSLSEDEVPPPHDSYTTHILMAGNITTKHNTHENCGIRKIQIFTTANWMAKLHYFQIHHCQYFIKKQWHSCQQYWITSLFLWHPNRIFEKKNDKSTTKWITRTLHLHTTAHFVTVPKYWTTYWLLLCQQSHLFTHKTI